MDRAMNKLKKFFKRRSRNHSIYLQVEDNDEHLYDSCMRERRQYIENEVTLNSTDFARIAEYDSVWSLEEIQARNMEEIVPILDSVPQCSNQGMWSLQDIQVRNMEEIVPTLDNNLYSDVNENASINMEYECSNQGNVSQIIYSLINDRFKDKTENTYETLPEIDDIMPESDDISQETEEDLVHSISEVSKFSETAEELQKELKIQKNIIVQSKKALQTSADYNFNGRIEEMEARRFLLIAETTRNMIEERLRNISLDLEGNGVVKFKNFRFSKKSMSLKLTKIFKEQKSETRLWFMIMMSYRKVVSANRVLEKSDHIVFEDELVFERLQVDFDLTMYLYCVSLKKEPKNKSGKSVENYWDLAAKFVFDKDDLRSNNLVLEEVSETCPLSGSFDVEVQTDVQINDTFSGFLNIKTHWKGENIWSHSWCILKGTKLLFYKYPGDVEFFYEIDLRKSKKNKVDQPDRAECPRRKSLVLQTKIGNGVSSDYISADSWELINEWERNINNALQLLKDWC